MRHIKSNALILIATLALSTGAVAQKIYKCGTSYSQLPCPDGVILPAASTPDAAQKKATDLATHRDAVTADRMEKSRLQQEQKDLAANTPPNTKQKIRKPEADTEPAPSIKKNKTKGKVEEFRAVVPGTAPSKKHSKK